MPHEPFGTVLLRPSAPDDSTFAGQFDRLRRLRDGWLDGDGLAPTAESLAVLERGFADSHRNDLPMPRLYPTAEGGVRAEWQFGSRDLSIETPFGETRAYLHLLDLDTNEEREDHLDLSRPAGNLWSSCFAPSRRTPHEPRLRTLPTSPPVLSR